MRRNTLGLWGIIGGSLGFHVFCLIASHTFLRDFVWDHHPVHAAVEMTGAIIAFFVAYVLIRLERRGVGTHFNLQITAALIGMGLLDGLHALTYAGQSFVWLHSTATFVGGVLFATVFLPSRWFTARPLWLPWSAFIVALLLGTVSMAWPEWTPNMIVATPAQAGQFTLWAKLLNIVGGVCLLASAAQLVRFYRKARNHDDLLFCLHCALFGAAAIMFEQSRLWDFAWWGWHILRLAAYGVALWFIVRTERETLDGLMQRLEEANQALERDVADRMQLLAERDVRLNTFLNTAADGVITIDTNGFIETFNAAAEVMFGYSRNEVIGRDLAMLMPPQYRSLHHAGLRRYRETGERRVLGTTVELSALRQNGEEFPVELSLSEMTFSGRQVFAGIVRDVTDRHEYRQAIEQKNKDLETLLYVTSHDLREPLRAIENFSRIVRQRHAGGLEAKAIDYLDRVVRGAQRLDGLLDDILTLSRAQRMSTDRQALSSRELVGDVLERLEGTIREKKADVQIVEPLPTIYAEPMWATQAIFNLVANALKFHKPETPPSIEIAAYLGNGQPATGLVIRDRGIGVPPEFAERIFTLFQRAVGREISGHGAGLAIVKQIAERHGGEVWVEPRQGGGAEFIITFPERPDS
ncbi:MAG: PAS domain S-box protein [Planctomycetales bacterium]|nr:PAS domain S-box protein [Planctomycetales bacterium]